MFAYSKLIIDNIAKNDGNLMIFGREEKLAGSAGDGVAEVFDIFAEPRAVLQPVSSVLASKTRTIRRFIISNLNK